MATFLVWMITALTVAAAMFAVAAVVSGRADLMADMPPDAVPPTLPEDRPARASDVEAVRFDRAFRGYRMDQVDAVLDRLSAELATRDETPARQADPQAMFELAEKVTVDAPASRVWQAMTAWDRQSEWVIATRTYATDLVGQGVGGGLESFTGIGPLRFKDTMVITEWRPPKICRVRHTGRVIRGTGAFEVESAGESGAVVTWTESLLMPFGRVGEACWPAVRPVASWVLRRSLKRFADWAPAYPR